MRCVALAGGVGGAKLLVGLRRALSPGALRAIVNTGDDAEIYGLHISPDVDICTYWLAGSADTDRGWGVRGDSFAVVDALVRLGRETWFRLGDADLATCLYRTERMAAGDSLSAITADVNRMLGTGVTLIPMTDDAVRTQIVTADERTLEFQEYFVKERTEPEVVEVVVAGAEGARPAPGVLEAIDGSDVVIVCPSNPVVSIGPILAVQGIRDALRAHPRVVAVTPIIKGAALKGPADRLLASLGHEPSATSVARLYADFCDVFVIDRSDPAELAKAETAGPRIVSLDTVMTDHEAAERLARGLLNL